MKKEIKLKVLTIIPLILEAIALLFLPSEIPVHYNSNFQVDRYGSKYNLLILGVFVVLFGWLMNYIYTKSKDTAYELIIYRLCVVALLVFNVMNLFAIYGSMFMGIDGTSIAVIGSADGPTTIFLAGAIGDEAFIFLLGIIGVLLGGVIFHFKKKKQ